MGSIYVQEEMGKKKSNPVLQVIMITEAASRSLRFAKARFANERGYSKAYLLLGFAHGSIDGWQINLPAPLCKAGSQLRAAAKVEVHIAAEDIAPGEALSHLSCAFHLHPCLISSLPSLCTQPLCAGQALSETLAQPT